MATGFGLMMEKSQMRESHERSLSENRREEGPACEIRREGPWEKAHTRAPQGRSSSPGAANSPAVDARFPVLDAERLAAGAWQQRARPQNLREGLTVTGRGRQRRLPL